MKITTMTNRNINYDYWEEYHFSEILDLYDIFREHFDDRLDVDFNSAFFIQYFSKFLYKYSYKDRGSYDLKELHQDNYNGEYQEIYEKYKDIINYG